MTNPTFDPDSTKTTPRFFHFFDNTHAAVLVFILGTLITFFAFLSIRQSETNKLEAEFGRLTTETSNAISQSIQAHTDDLEAIRSFYNATDTVTRSAFSEFTRPFFSRRSGTRALEWIPRITDAQRDSFVVSVRRIGFPRFDILERDIDGNLGSRTFQDEYFPVCFVEPFRGNELALGFDLASEPVRRRALEESRDQGAAVATPRIQLVHTPGGEGFLIFLPVYDEPLLTTTVDKRRRALRGFVLGVFELSEILRTAQGFFSAEGIDVRLEDRSAPKGEQLLAAWDSESRTHTKPGSLADLTRFPPRLTREVAIDVGRRNWCVVCTASPIFFERNQATASVVVLISGIVFSTLLMFYLLRLSDGAKKLRESESRYRSMVDFSPDAVMIVDVDKGRFVNANGKALELFGTDMENLLKKGPGYFSPKVQPDGTDTQEHAQRVIGQALAGETPVFEWVHLRADGTPVPCEVRIHQVPDTGRTLICRSVTDITERKRQESNKLALDRKIQYSQRLESLELLCGGVAHDFNNLLTPILGRAGLALEELPSDSSVRKHLEDIELTAQRAGELIRLFLAYTGQANLVVSKVPINLMITETGHLLKSTRPKDVDLELALSPNSPVIKGDSGQIRQIIMNLITNATDAIGPNPGTIFLASGEVSADRAYLNRFIGNSDLGEGRYAWLEVSDTGCGMDEETVSRVFDPFFTTKEKGRGLGLASTLGIAKSHGGAIQVQTKKGGGTTFRVIFPLENDPGSTLSPPRKPLAKIPGAGLALIADDEMSVRSLVGALLKKVGFETVEAVDGIEAVEMFRKHVDTLQVAILDLTMPNLSGVEVHEQIRKIQPNIPVVLMSGYSEKLTESRHGGLMHSTFIQKPFKPEQFLETVRKLIKA